MRSFLKKIGLIASTTAEASLNVPHGTAPSSPVDGDVWTTSAGLYARVNGTTVGPLGVGGSGGDVENVVSSDDSVAANKSRIVVGYLELAAAFEIAGNVEVL